MMELKLLSLMGYRVERDEELKHSSDCLNNPWVADPTACPACVRKQMSKSLPEQDPDDHRDDDLDRTGMDDPIDGRAMDDNPWLDEGEEDYPGDPSLDEKFPREDKEEVDDRIEDDRGDDDEVDDDK